jgi:hypothetical protein
MSGASDVATCEGCGQPIPTGDAVWSILLPLRNLLRFGWACWTCIRRASAWKALSVPRPVPATEETLWSIVLLPLHEVPRLGWVCRSRILRPSEWVSPAVYLPVPSAAPPALRRASPRPPKRRSP